jgi:hypothetical protein
MREEMMNGFNVATETTQDLSVQKEIEADAVTLLKAEEEMHLREIEGPEITHGQELLLHDATGETLP